MLNLVFIYRETLRLRDVSSTDLFFVFEILGESRG
jgi:hypothetical protein